MMSPNARFEALLGAALAATGAGADRAIGADIARLSRLFGAERSERRADYMADPRLRRAYLSFFLPQYARKIALLLERLTAEGLLSLPARPRVLDVGAGPLSATAGVWLHAGGLGPSTALDLAGAAMAAGRDILAAAAGDRADPVALVEAPLSRRPLPAGPFDLVVIAHVLNELGDPRRSLPMRASLLRALTGVLAEGGRVLVVEPGTRVHGRALMAVRDALSDEGMPVLSPCRAAPACPLLRRPGDWCHGDLPWQRPPAFIALEDAAGLPKDTLKASHLLLARRGETSPSTGLRLVGGLMRGDDGVERRYGCGRTGLVVLRGTPLPPRARDPTRGALLADERGVATEARPSSRPSTRGPHGAAGRDRGRGRADRRH